MITSVLKNIKLGRLLIGFLFLLLSVTNGYSQQKTVAAGLEVVGDAQSVVNNANEWVTKIDDAFNTVTSSGAYKTLVDGKSIQFPFGILPDNGNSDYALVVNGINVDQIGRMSAEIYMKIPYKSGEHLYFLADKVPLNKEGKLQDTLKLFLMKTASMSVGKGYDLEFKGLDNTDNEYSYVSFSCSGFNKLHLNGALHFNPEAVVAHEEDEKKPKQPVSLDFFISVDYLTNMIVTFDNVPDLNFKSLPGFKISVPSLVLDKSDADNAPNFNLPKWYLDSLSKKVSGLDPTIYGSAMWEGVYIPSLSIEIPKSFSEGNDTIKDNVVISSQDFIVDHYGITALTHAKSDSGTGVVSGKIKGFKHRIDSLRLNVIASTLSRAGFWGEMAFPICKEESTVGFGLLISQGLQDDSELEYAGYADFKGNLSASAFGIAQMKLTRCELEFEYSNKQFFPSVALDGSLTIAPKKKKASTSSGNFGMEFARFEINSTQPYVDIGSGGYFRLKTGNNSSKLGALPISFTSGPEIVKERSGQRMGLRAGISVSFQKSKENSSSSGQGFSGGGEFTIWADRDPVTNRWGYDDFQIDSIGIEAQGSGYKLKGYVNIFQDDPVYYKGFCGRLDLEVIDKFTVIGAAIFGKVTATPEAEPSATLASGPDFVFNSNDEPILSSTTYRYWFVDAAVSFSPGIPLFAGVELNSFTGGIYKNMAMVKSVSGSTVECLTASGRSYVPHAGVLGLVAGIGIQSTGGGDAFNGEINLGLEMFTDGGLKRIATWGGVEFFTGAFEAPQLAAVAEKMDTEPAGDDKEDELEADVPPTSSLAANWYVEYDFPNKTLDGRFDIYVNLADVVRGTGTGNKAGRISIYSSPSEWYLYVGQPTEDLAIGIDVIGLVQAKSYLCLGSVLPDPPIMPMPSEIQPKINIDYNLLSVGGGLSLGARIVLDGFPKLPLIPCNLEVGLKFMVKAGFDILLSKASEPIYCTDVGERGINDWYATGQAFLYGEASLRAQWGCWYLGSGSADILSMYLSTYVFAQLPHPSYLAGGVRIGFRVIGIGFSKRFDLEFGETCDAQSEVAEVDFIEAINPADATENVEVGQEIDVYFSKPLRKFTYKIQNEEGSDGEVYRGNISKELISITSNSGESIDFIFELSDDMRQMKITPKQVLPGGEQITVTINVVTEKEGEEEWIPTDRLETKAVTFTTEPEKTYIPLSDVYYSYPLPGMKNFYPQETTRGYVRFSTLPRDVVELHKDYEFAVAFYEGNNRIDISREVEYDDTYGAKNFTYDLPTSQLESGKKYTFKLLKSPIPTFTTQTGTAQGNTTVGTVDLNYQDTTILSFEFTTSTFANFSEKMSLYSTSMSEVFDGVTAANLSLNTVKELDENAFEPLTDLETVGYVKDGVRVTESLIRFGDISYFNSSVQDIQDNIDTYESILFANDMNGQKYTTVSSLFDDVNYGLTELNMNCLLEGGCSGDQLKVVNIPAGKFTLPIGYYAPGEQSPSSVYDLIIDIDQDIILPF